MKTYTRDALTGLTAIAETQEGRVLEARAQRREARERAGARRDRERAESVNAACKPITSHAHVAGGVFDVAE